MGFHIGKCRRKIAQGFFGTRIIFTGYRRTVCIISKIMLSRIGHVIRVYGLY